MLTFEEIKLKLINYCTYQDRSHKEVEKKMRDFLLIPEAKDELILYLIREKFLDEERFTRSYIRGKFYQKHWGRNKIRVHLRQKGITNKLMERCFDEIDHDDYRKTIRKMWTQYFDKQKGLQEYQKKVKTTRYLLGRGFEYDEINDAIEADFDE